MKKFLILFTLVLFLFGCANNFNESSLVVKAPNFIDTQIAKNIVGGGVDISNESQYRYVIAIENGNRTIDFITLQSNEAKSVVVPSNTLLTIKVGIYYAVDGSSTYEKYNSYIGTATKDNIMVATGETKEITFDIKLNDLPVNVYYDSLFGKNKVSIVNSAFQGSDGIYFSLTPLVNSGDSSSDSMSRVVKFSNQNFSLVNLNPYVNGAKFLAVKNAPNDKNIWFLSKTGLYFTDSSLSTFENKFNWTDFSKVSTIMDFKVKPQTDNEIDRYHYLLEKGISSFYPISYGLESNGHSWSTLGDVDVSDLPSPITNEPLVVDISRNDAPDTDKVLLSTNLGLYYVTESFFSDVLNGTDVDPNKVISNIKKNIKIDNPENSAETIFIRKAKFVGKTIYLGTKSGLYSINKDSSEWKEFANASFQDITYLKQSAITKVAEFGYDEYISTMDVVNNVLIVSTPKRIWFKNLTNNQTSQVTVWNGLPFIPLKGFSNSEKLNTLEYGTQFLAPVKDIVYDSTNLRYWILTSFGLASIDANKLF